MEELLKYAARPDHHEKIFNIEDKNDHGEYVHQEIMDKVPNVRALDRTLFNELVSMVSGEKADTKYILQNV